MSMPPGHQGQGVVMQNSMQPLNKMVKHDYNGVVRDDGGDSDAPSSVSKTPTRLPPFSPNFARGGLPTNKDDSDRGDLTSPRPVSARLHQSVDGDEGAKDLSRADSLPDLSGRLGENPCSPPPVSPLGKSL